MREFARRWLGDADAVTLVPVTTDRRIPILLEDNVDLIAAAVGSREMLGVTAKVR